MHRRAMESLQQECIHEGRGEFFEEAKPWLTGDAGHGDQKDLARRNGMNETALKAAIPSPAAGRDRCHPGASRGN